MSEENEIKHKSRTAKLLRDTVSGAGRGLKIGLGIGLGAGAFFAITGMLLFSAPLTAAIGAVVASTVGTAVLGTAVGTAYGALKGLFTSPRPKGDLGTIGVGQDEERGAGVDGVQQGPQLPDNQPVYANERPAPLPQQGHSQASQAELQQLRQLTDQLNASRAQPADWQSRVSRERATANSQGPSVG